MYLAKRQKSARRHYWVTEKVQLVTVVVLNSNSFINYLSSLLQGLHVILMWSGGLQQVQQEGSHGHAERKCFWWPGKAAWGWARGLGLGRVLGTGPLIQLVGNPDGRLDCDVAIGYPDVGRQRGGARRKHKRRRLKRRTLISPLWTAIPSGSNHGDNSNY